MPKAARAGDFFAKARSFMPRGMILGAFCGAVALWSSATSSARIVEDWAFDWCFAARFATGGARGSEARDKIVLIGIDDDSLDALKLPLIEIGPSLAKVVAFVTEMGALTVGVDLIMPFASDPRFGADKMGEAVEDSGNVVLAAALSRTPEGNRRFIRSTNQWKDPKSNDGVGVVNLDDDQDHFIRRQQLFYADDDQVLPQFDVALRDQGKGNPPQPTAEQLRINFVGPPGTFTVRSFQDVLKAAEKHETLLAKGDFEGKIVLIGVTARTQQNRHATPYSNRAFHVGRRGETI